jgi:hypothetical protein
VNGGLVVEPFLGFTSAWQAAGVITVDSLAEFVRYVAKDPAKPARHWRWLAFRDFAEEHIPLNDDQCRVLFHLGEREPDVNLGTAMMCCVLYQKACPDEVWAKAKDSDREAVRRIAVRQENRKTVAVPASPTTPTPSV